MNEIKKPVYTTEHYYVMKGFDSHHIYKKVDNKRICSVWGSGKSGLKEAIAYINEIQNK